MLKVYGISSNKEIYYKNNKFVIKYLNRKIIATIQEIEKSDERDPAPVDMTPWPKAKDASMAIVLATVAIYILLSLAAS